MRLLYCVVYNHYNPRTKRLSPGKQYLHADSDGDAKRKFCLANPNRQTHQIIAAAPTIGVFQDDDGKLTVD